MFGVIIKIVVTKTDHTQCYEYNIDYNVNRDHTVL